jgi:hypothetical protein
MTYMVLITDGQVAYRACTHWTEDDSRPREDGTGFPHDNQNGRLMNCFWNFPFSIFRPQSAVSN